MTFSTPPSLRAIDTSVKNIPIKFNPTIFRNMLIIPSIGTSLSHITMDNPGVIENIIIRGRKFKPGMSANSLQPLPRIIARIFSYNIIPKTGSYTYISNDLLKCVYAVMAGLDVNWARIVYDNLCKPCTTHLPHGNFLTRVFTAFNVPLNTEVEKLPLAVIFDKKAIKRMGLTSEEPILGEEEDEHIADPTSEDDTVDYADLIHQVQNLSTTQDRLVASHYVMQHQLSNIRENQSEMMRYQAEMMHRFNQQFPPPPPPQ